MATIAVFLALGGGAYAALKLPKNSVGAKQLKPGSVRSAEVKNNKLTGNDVLESTFGVVPNAAHADTADRATRADDADRAADADTLGGLGPGAFARADQAVVQRGTVRWTADADSVVENFMTRGPFTLTLGCRYNANTEGTLRAKTTAANTSYTSSGDGAILGPTSDHAMVIAHSDATSGGPGIATAGVPFALSAPDGRYLVGHAAVVADDTSTPLGYECRATVWAISG
jgi:hypothetical protein